MKHARHPHINSRNRSRRPMVMMIKAYTGTALVEGEVCGLGIRGERREGWRGRRVGRGGLAWRMRTREEVRFTQPLCTACLLEHINTSTLVESK